MPGYKTKQESVRVTGVADVVIRSLLDKEQYSDPNGCAEKLGISSATWPIFGMLWPSGAHLAARLVARLAAHPLVKSERILEVGCGLALASLVAHRAGLDVTASDHHPLAESFLFENLKLNGLPPMKYCHADWHADRDADRDATPVTQGETSKLGRFDLIIGSDLLYDRNASQALAGFIEKHAERHAEVWIVDPNRGNRSGFNRDMSAQGFARSEYRLDCAASAHGEAYKGRMLTYVRS